MIKWLFPLLVSVGIATAGNFDVLFAYDYMNKRPNFTEPNLHCWLLVHTAFDPNAHPDALTMVVTTLGDTRFEGYIFAKSAMATNGTIEIVHNVVTRDQSELS
jgi:hypothetical protein